MILDKINKPNDIKNINPDEYMLLSQEIRTFLIKKISENGGHLGSNLGAVELTMALHIAFFNLLNCILLAINDHIALLPYFDTEYFQGSEWYFWEVTPSFKLAYVVVGILGPLAVKWIFDKICAAVGNVFRRKSEA